MPQAPSILLAKPWSLPTVLCFSAYPSCPLLVLTLALTLYPWHLLHLTALIGLHVYQTRGQTWPVDQGLQTLGLWVSALLFSIPITVPHTLQLLIRVHLTNCWASLADDIRHPYPYPTPPPTECLREKC